MPHDAGPEVAFLGFAERAALVRDGQTDVLKWNVLGLKNLLLVNFFPVALNGWNIALAIRNPTLSDIRITFFDEDNQNLGWINIGIAADTAGMPLTRTDAIALRSLPQTWSPVFFSLSGPTPVIQKPGRYTLKLKLEDGKDEPIGEFYCVLVDPAALTAERIAAIRSNPHAAKHVRAVFGCNFCPSKFRVYAGLERHVALETDGFTWYQEIAENFSCECGRTNLDLTSVKRNFHALLGQRLTTSKEASYVPLYEKSGIDSLRLEFINLLNLNTPEESLQIFLEKNRILLHQFPAERLFFKPPILTRFRGGFCHRHTAKGADLYRDRAGKHTFIEEGWRPASRTHSCHWAGSELAP
jgi:hypothetical protein